MRSKAPTKTDQKFAQLLLDTVDNQSKRRGLKPDPADRVAVQKLLGVELKGKRK